jgi:formiminotetrahydrofolate cyclodeaminase
MADGGLAALSVEEFLRRLAGGDPTPGGGAASALAGALGASLVSMVCNLTLGRARYAELEAGATEMQAEADALRQRLQVGIDEDAAAYGAVIAAYQLPRTTDDEKAARSDAIQQTTRQAALVPLALFEANAQVIELADRALG